MESKVKMLHAAAREYPTMSIQRFNELYTLAVKANKARYIRNGYKNSFR